MSRVRFSVFSGGNRGRIPSGWPLYVYLRVRISGVEIKATGQRSTMENILSRCRGIFFSKRRVLSRPRCWSRWKFPLIHRRGSIFHRLDRTALSVFRRFVSICSLFSSLRLFLYLFFALPPLSLSLSLTLSLFRSFFRPLYVSRAYSISPGTRLTQILTLIILIAP